MAGVLADNIGDDPAVLEFLHHPSYRSVASFFLSFVFVCAVRYSVQLPLSIFRRLYHALFGRRRHVNTISMPTEKVHSWLTSTTSLTPASTFPPINSVLNNLSLGLTICFGLAGVSQFGSLLVFSQSGLPACAFLVAWTGIATQTAKLLGLLNLSFDLRRLGMRKWESISFWSLLGAGFVVMFASNAVSVGTLRGLPNSSTDAICFRERHIGTAAATIAINVVLELYCIVRTMYCLVPGFLYPKHKVEALLDIRVARSLSLLALDIATAPQLFVFFGVLADSIPSSLLTIIVLAAFNQYSPFSPTLPTASIPITRPGSAYSRSTIEIRKMPSIHSPQHISHPFAASALLDETPESEDWTASAAAVGTPQFTQSGLFRNISGSSRRTSNFLAPPAAASNKRISAQSEADSDVSRSVKNAVLGFAFRKRDSTRGLSFSSALPARTAKAELIVLTKSRNPIQSLPMSPITPASQQPQIEITLTSNTSDDSVMSLPSRASPPPSPRVSDITGLDSSSSSRKETLSILTSTSTFDSGLSSARLPVSRNRSLSDRRSSFHLTPTTPAVPPLSPSHRASTDSTEWIYDTYLVPEQKSRHASYASRETEGHSTSSSFIPGTSTPVLGRQEPFPSGPSSQTQRCSAVLPPADDDLSVVYEASHEESDSLIPPSRPARPSTLAFGQPLSVLTVDFGNTLSDVIEHAERPVTHFAGDEINDGEEVRGIREDMFVAGGIGRPITTPVGVPEDVDGRPRNGSGSVSGSGIPPFPIQDERQLVKNVSSTLTTFAFIFTGGMLLAVLLTLLPFSFVTPSHFTPLQQVPVTQVVSDGCPRAHTQIPRSLSFEHRHLHSITSSGQILFADVKGDALRYEASEDDDPFVKVRTKPINIYRPPSFESFMHERHMKWSAAYDRVYGNDGSNVPLTEDKRFEATWSEEVVEGPDIIDRLTLLSLAKMTRNAYLDINDDVSQEWYELDGWNRTFPFGWEEDADGLRGHVFVTADNKTVIIAIKGTSLTFLGGGGPTAKRDKLNDNLLFSCCCAAIDFTWIPVCPCSISFFGSLCNQTCLEESLLEESLFYSIAVNLYRNVSAIYPDATIWTTGHSLGGAVASLVALTFGIPSVTFEAPGERMAAERLRLPLPPSTNHITHVYHTADPIPMGTCNGIFSACALAGYALESSCHLGQTIVYDTVTELCWEVDVRTHPIKVIVERLLSNKWTPNNVSGLPPSPGDDPVPEARPQEGCVECYQWDYV